MNYSFITILDNKVINIEEKNKISDNYCCGIYGFKDAATFLDYSSKLILDNNKTKNEFYFSQMYKTMLLDNVDILPVHITKTGHIGTLEEIQQNARANPGLNTGMSKLRICFDLDNTLVSYPSIPGDYSTVKPIFTNINLLNNLKRAGHEIIIYTARRMATHKHNLGKVMKDIALITLESLDALGIEYDEIIFGKPIADIYIDDRAINPYITDISYFGLMFDKSDYIPNKLDNNKYNTITRKGNHITKIGPYAYMRGELYFYQNIPSSNTNLSSNPKLNNSSLSLK
jgi:capsule biosynthesis phosphatase